MKESHTKPLNLVLLRVLIMLVGGIFAISMSSIEVLLILARKQVCIALVVALFWGIFNLIIDINIFFKNMRKNNINYAPKDIIWEIFTLLFALSATLTSELFPNHYYGELFLFSCGIYLIFMSLAFCLLGNTKAIFLIKKHLSK